MAIVCGATQNLLYLLEVNDNNVINSDIVGMRSSQLAFVIFLFDNFNALSLVSVAVSL